MTVSDRIQRATELRDDLPPPWVGQRMTLDEFLKLPDAKPHLEFDDGLVTQKMSPKLTHATLQDVVVTRFNEVARPRRLGRAWPELRFVSHGWAPVPDVAYYRRERIRLQDGRFPVDLFEAPDIAVEIVSPDQSVTDLIKKCLRYIGLGTLVALVVDPGPETVLAFRAGQPVLALQGDDCIELNDVLPGLELTVGALFDSLAPDDWDDEDGPEAASEPGHGGVNLSLAPSLGAGRALTSALLYTWPASDNVRRRSMILGFVRTIGELFHFLVQRRAWFLIPIVVGLLAIGALIVLASATPLGPFIYTIF